MEMTTIRVSEVRLSPELKAPAFKTRKDWRRYQVALKRMGEAMDASILRSIYGDRYGCNPPPTSYPPKREPHRSWLEYAASVV
jgi:hypothetical protein